MLDKEKALTAGISLLIILILSLLMLLEVKGKSQSSLLPNEYRIYFASDRDGDFDLYSLKYPNGIPVNITKNNTWDGEPCVSLDGEKVVYSSLIKGVTQICMMNYDGSNKVQLTNSDIGNNMPSISFDKRKIVFISNRDLNAEVYTMDLKTGKEKRLTFDPPAGKNITYDKPLPPEVEKTRERDPSWDPRGGKILFTSYRDGNADLFLMNADGTAQKHLTYTTIHYHNIQGVFTPDGKKIVWASDREGDYDLYIMNRDGTDIKHLTSGGFGSHYPRFSRDGKKIVFCSDLQAPNWEIFIMDSNGNNIEQVTEDDAEDWTPCIY